MTTAILFTINNSSFVKYTYINNYSFTINNYSCY